jgi:hypothetical protein
MLRGYNDHEEPTIRIGHSQLESKTGDFEANLGKVVKGLEWADKVEALRADRALGEPLRQAALRAVLRRAQPPGVAPGNPIDHGDP